MGNCQYQFYRAENVYAGMIQTESPYYQPAPSPPAPFSSSAESMPGDPDYSLCSDDATLPGCDASWAVRIVESKNIEIGGAGLYTWFNNYVQEPCVDSMDCQLAQLYIENTNGNVSIYNLITIGAVDMLVDETGAAPLTVTAADNLYLEGHPYWSEMAIYRPYAVESSGGDSGDEIYVPPSVWDDPDPSVGCLPPCTLILPPFPMGFTTTISWPLLTTTVMSVTGMITKTITTVLTVPAVTTTEINWWPVTIGSTSLTKATFTPVQSVMPDPFIVSFPPNVAPFPPSDIPDPAEPFSTTSSTTTTILVGYIPSTSHPVTIQPQPTISMSTPPPTNVPTVTWSSEKPKSTCKTGCGHYDCGLFGCGGGCGLFGCGGGCGIWGCGGGCGLFGCGGSSCPLGSCDGGCALLSCGGVGCATGECGSLGCPSGDCSLCPAGGCGGFHPNPDDDCTELEEAEVCTLVVSSFIPAGTTTWSTTTKTHCETVEACTVTGTTVTTTITTSTSDAVVTASLYNLLQPSAAGADITSRANYLASMRNAWDATRWGTTVQSTTTTDTGGSAPAQPTAILLIGLEFITNGPIENQIQAHWNVYTPGIGQDYDSCTDDIGTFAANGDIAQGKDDVSTIFPDGTYDFDFDVLGTSGCSYAGTADGPGTLSCPDLASPVTCGKDAYYGQIYECAFDDTDDIYPKVSCSWG